MSLDDLKLQIQKRKDMKELKGKLGVLDSVNKGILKLIDEFKKLREGQSNEVVVKNLPDPVKEVTVSNFPEQKDSVKIDGDVSLKEPKWFSFKGIEKSVKTLGDRIEKAIFKVDLDKYKNGTQAIAVKLVDKDGKPYVAKGGGAFPSFGSMNMKDRTGEDVNPATKESQEAIATAIREESEITATAVDANQSGDNVIVAITNTPKLYYFSISANGANDADVTAILKIGSSVKYKVSLKPGSIFARNISAEKRYVGGADGGDIIVNLSAPQTVHVSVEYEDAP